jgi:hypothetical protein
MTTRCPRLFYICRTHGLAAKPALELLINNPLESRASVVPALAERVSRPLISNRTLRGTDFFRALGSIRVRVTLTWQGTGPLKAHSRGCGRALWARLFRRRHRARNGRRGGGRDGPPRPFGCRAVMIARARASGRFGDMVPASSMDAATYS